MTDETDRVLVVEDDRTISLMLAYRLQTGGIAADTAENGRQALKMLEEQSFDVVLLDIIMPEMDGYAVLEHIKSVEKLRDIPVIMMSGLGEMDSVVRCLEAGAEDYLPKPLDSLLLLARVKGILLRKHMKEMEEDYQSHIGQLLEAATAIESGTFQPEKLKGIANRGDILGQLAQEFHRIALTVSERKP